MESAISKANSKLTAQIGRFYYKPCPAFIHCGGRFSIMSGERHTAHSRAALASRRLFRVLGLYKIRICRRTDAVDSDPLHSQSRTYTFIISRLRSVPEPASILPTHSGFLTTRPIYTTDLPQNNLNFLGLSTVLRDPERCDIQGDV